MDRFHHGLADKTLAVYMDDLIVISDTFENHVSDLRAVFDHLRLFQKHARRKKCVFACESVKYLGHVITSESIQTDPRKVHAILDKKPQKKNVKEVLTFYQTCSWYRRFIQGFLEIARPLSALTKKNACWEWDQQQAAFDRLKSILTNPPVVKQADPIKPYTIRANASSYGLGAVLLQGEGADERPIEYASRLLLPAGTRYTTRDRERERGPSCCVGHKFRPYIECNTVVVAS